MLSIRFIVSATILLASSACGYVYYYDHNEVEAGRAAEQFAMVAFVQRDFETARSLSITPERSAADFEQYTIATHPSGRYPAEVVATHYKIVPNSGMIVILLRGQGADGVVHHYQVSTRKNDRGRYVVTAVYQSPENTSLDTTGFLPLKR